MSKMSIAFCTHCSDDWFYAGGCSKLINSAKYFHPDIPFIVFNNIELNIFNERHKGKLNWCNLMPVVSSEVAKHFDKVIKFDADSMILGPLDGILEFTEDVCVVRNNNDFDTASMFHDPPALFNNCAPEDYYNAGLVGSTRPEFWDEWMVQNDLFERQLMHREQDVMNKLLQEQKDKYSKVVLDSKDKPVHYGISCHYGKDTWWDSAKEFTYKDGEFFLKDKVVKVWHQAGGSRYFPKLQLEKFFTPEIIKEIEKITNTTSIYEKIVV